MSTLSSRLALIVPLLVAAGVLGLYTCTVRRPGWQSQRRARHHTVL